MSCHRIDELIELLSPEWKKQGHLNLVEIIAELTKEAGHGDDLSSITDDMLICEEMKGEEKDAMIPGIAKDVEVEPDAFA